jgi:hypothetical protein
LLSIITCSTFFVAPAWAQTTTTVVTVNAANTVAIDQYVLGFTLGDAGVWLSSSAEQQLAKNANFKMVHLFDASLKPCTQWYESSKTGTFNWTSVDSLVQKIFAIGAQPIISLGFCSSGPLGIPSGMAVNPSTGLPYPSSFAAYCRAWVNHMKTKGFNVKYYEIFNEAWYYFYPTWTRWNSTKAGYFLQVFNACYEAMHLANPQVLVGNDASLHRKFLDYWIAHGGKLNFLSFHKYDCYAYASDQATLQRVEQHFFITDSLFYGVNDARKLWYNAHGVTLPAIATEANWAATYYSGTDPRLQQVVGAVWTALMIRSSILNNVQCECYFKFASSKTDELAHRSSGGYGFGMINQDNNQPWYPYYVQKLIGTNLVVGDKIVYSTSSTNVRSLAWVHGGKLNLLLICKSNELQYVKFSGLQGTLTYFKIDNAVSYQTPRVQTGTVSATATLSLNGYTVMLIQK